MGATMSVTEFFSYLLDSDATRELAAELAKVCAVRARVHDEERVLVHA